MKRNLYTLMQTIRNRTKPTGGGERPIVRTSVQARQGMLGKPILLVLVASMILIVVALTLIVMLGQ